jgi:MFS family permease
MAEGATSPSEREAAEGTARRSTLGMTAVAHFVHDGIADSLYVLLPFWAQSLGLNYTQVGSLKTAYSAAMAVFQMPSGLLAERVGERVLLAAGTIVAGVAFAALALAQSYPIFGLLILAVGIGSAVQHPLASSLISGAYAAGMRRAALGVYNFSGDVGKTVVAFSIAAAAAIAGWRASVLGYGLIVALTGIVLLFALGRLGVGGKRKITPAALANLDPAAVAPARAGGWGFSNRSGYAILSTIHIIDSAARTGCLTLLPFLLLQKEAGTATVGLALALVFAGGAAGKLACGLLAERLGILRTVVLTELATAGLLLATIAAPLQIALLCMPVLGIALNGTSSVLYGSVAEFVRADRQARAFGLFYALGSAAGGSAPLVFGIISDWVGVATGLLCLAAFVLSTLPLSMLLAPHLRAPHIAAG